MGSSDDAPRTNAKGARAPTQGAPQPLFPSPHSWWPLNARLKGTGSGRLLEKLQSAREPAGRLQGGGTGRRFSRRPVSTALPTSPAPAALDLLGVGRGLGLNLEARKQRSLSWNHNFSQKVCRNKMGNKDSAYSPAVLRSQRCPSEGRGEAAREAFALEPFWRLEPRA